MIISPTSGITITVDNIDVEQIALRVSEGLVQFDTKW